MQVDTDLGSAAQQRGQHHDRQASGQSGEPEQVSSLQSDFAGSPAAADAELSEDELSHPHGG